MLAKGAYDSDSDYGDYHDDDCEREDADQTEFLLEWDPDVPQHDDGYADDWKNYIGIPKLGTCGFLLNVSVIMSIEVL